MYTFVVQYAFISLSWTVPDLDALLDVRKVSSEEIEVFRKCSLVIPKSGIPAGSLNCYTLFMDPVGIDASSGRIPTGC